MLWSFSIPLQKNKSITHHMVGAEPKTPAAMHAAACWARGPTRPGMTEAPMWWMAFCGKLALRLVLWDGPKLIRAMQVQNTIFFHQSPATPSPCEGHPTFCRSTKTNIELVTPICLSHRLIATHFRIASPRQQLTYLTSTFWPLRPLRPWPSPWP